MKIYKIIQLCEYKELKFEVELDFYYNNFIEEYYTDITLGNENLRKIRNEYRRIKGLLIDDEIKEIRGQYNLSQRDFAVALGFGEVTITRYESKTVQDRIQDIVIRQSKNPNEFLKYLELNKEKYIDINGYDKYNEIYEKVFNMTKDIDFLVNQNSLKDRGNSIFSIEKLKTIIGKIKIKRKFLSKTFLAKLLWYIDCLNYKLKNKSMTGLTYISMPFGAYPKMYEEILNNEDIKIKRSWINDHECQFIEYVNSYFILTEEEEKIIDFILNKFEKFNSEQLVDYMHKEKAYIETNKFDVIAYDYAIYIKTYEDFK